MHILQPKSIILMIFIIFLSYMPADAGNRQEAIDAYNAGDYAAWLKITHQLAVAGDANARFILGEAYRTGDRVEKNLEESFKWFRLAADQGDADAWLSLGLAWENGEGVPRNYEEAYYCYYMACKKGRQAQSFVDRTGWKLSALKRREIRARVDCLSADKHKNKPAADLQQSASENEAQ